MRDDYDIIPIMKDGADNAVRDIPVYSWAEIAAQFDEYFKELIK